MTPLEGAPLTLTAEVYEPSPQDPLTYAWTGPGGFTAGTECIDGICVQLCGNGVIDVQGGYSRGNPGGGEIGLQPFVRGKLHSKLAAQQ